MFTLSMEGGLKREELERSVFRRLLLGVSGLIKELSWPPPNIMLGKAAEVEYLVARARRAPEAETWNKTICQKRTKYVGVSPGRAVLS